MKVLNKTEQIAHSDGKTSSSAIQYMLMGSRSTPHPATGHTPYEALMKRTVRTKLDYGHFSKNRKFHNMEQEITKRDKEYKRKWNKQQRHPKCKEHHFKIGDKVLLKKKKINKWCTCHEKQFYVIIEIHGSSITARRKSDGRTIDRDASKFRFFYDVRNDNWRERLLHSSRGVQSGLAQNKREEERTRQDHNEQRGEDYEPAENNHPPRRQARQQRNHRGGNYRNERDDCQQDSKTMLLKQLCRRAH